MSSERGTNGLPENIVDFISSLEGKNGDFLDGIVEKQEDSYRFVVETKVARYFAIILPRLRSNFVSPVATEEETESTFEIVDRISSSMNDSWQKHKEDKHTYLHSPASDMKFLKDSLNGSPYQDERNKKKYKKNVNSALRSFRNHLRHTGRKQVFQTVFEGEEFEKPLWKIW